MCRGRHRVKKPGGYEARYVLRGSYWYNSTDIALSPGYSVSVCLCAAVGKTGPVALASENLFTCNMSPRTAMGVAHQQLPRNFAMSFKGRLAQPRLRASKSRLRRKLFQVTTGWVLERRKKGRLPKYEPFRLGYMPRSVIGS